VSLATPPKLRRLQEALYTKAKQEPAYRFYLLYDKVHRADILAHAYALSKQHGGAPGVDGVTFCSSSVSTCGGRRPCRPKAVRSQSVKAASWGHVRPLSARQCDARDVAYRDPAIAPWWTGVGTAAAGGRLPPPTGEPGSSRG
jgi:hypothetical protein